MLHTSWKQTVSSNGIVHTLSLPRVIMVRGSSNKSALTIIPKKIDITFVDTLVQRAGFVTKSLSPALFKRNFCSQCDWNSLREGARDTWLLSSISKYLEFWNKKQSHHGYTHKILNKCNYHDRNDHSIVEWCMILGYGESHHPQRNIPYGNEKDIHVFFSSRNNRLIL